LTDGEVSDVSADEVDIPGADFSDGMYIGQLDERCK
jgi:hypothetical protein